ncbi:MAG: hypothetical protein FWF81_13065 [Defluviitaleaceae bacterium]|nr:hypothetical protein [Defluviitaleaceae bacterium]
MKKIFLLVFILFLSACADTDAAGGEVFTIEQIQGNPREHLGEISLTGIVGSVNSHDFVLQNGANTFEVTIDYRGNQAFPQVGDTVTVEGRFIENPPCCGGGFSITSTRFELVE